VDNLLNQSESSTTGEKGVSETNESEEQSDNVSGDKVDEEQDTEPETDSGQSVDTQHLPKKSHLPEVREVITRSKSSFP